MARTCDNCGEPCGEDDLFCESCGYDFVTGSMPPAAGDGPAATSAAGSDTTGADSGTVGADQSGDADGDGQPTANRVPSLVDEASNDIARVVIKVAPDPSFFEAMVTEGEVNLPDPLPPEQELELFGNELHVGRTSESRGIHPNVDVEALTGDPAVSTRHAVLRVANDGTHTVTDVGSTNGTFIDDFGGDPITQGIPITLNENSIIYLGAWTKLTVETG